jgi:cysteine desulfurase
MHTAVRPGREWPGHAVQLAALVRPEPPEIVFTGSATEANNLAILGVADALRGSGRHLVTSAVEHPAVTRPIEHKDASANLT